MQTLNDIVQDLQPIAEAGFPGCICPVIFLGGCNFTCPYCLNADIVTSSSERRRIPLSDIENYVKDNGEDNILISGGEPCLQPLLGDLIDALKAMGLKVRLSTNGSRHEVLHRMIYKHGVSFVAMDIKTDLYNPLKYKMFMSETDRIETMTSMAILNETVKDKHGLPDGFSFEFRTTLYPPAVGKDEIEKISHQISPQAIWYLQQFRPRRDLLSKEAETMTAHSDEELNELLAIARKTIKSSFVRWP